MKKVLFYISFLLITGTASAQYYLRGEIKDENAKALANAKILLLSKNQRYTSGPFGGFGITTNDQFDSILVTLDGYDQKLIKVNCEQWQNIVLKMLPSNVSSNRPKLISVTKNLDQTTKMHLYINNETYFQLVENEYVVAQKFPNTGFSLNVNKASYSNVRRFINMNSMVPPDAVRTEEMINYFNLHYHEPEKDSIFSFESQLASCPWDTEKQLLYLNVSAKKLNLNMVPPGNFVFLIDVSGSMDQPNRLPMLKAAFQMFVKNLRPIDTMSIVSYGGNVSIDLQPTGGAEKEKILKVIESLSASGDTPGEAALITAYELARHIYKEGASNRVILATDADFNRGETSEKALDDLITKERQFGIYLTCLGVGVGNFKDSKLAVLAKKGNGNFAYLDNINEAEKVLVKELTQTFYAVADDVFMNLKFNSNYVKSYRLIGFDNRRDAVVDTTVDLEGGEIGSGNSVLAIFEIIPVADKKLQPDMFSNASIADIEMRYSKCNDTAHLYFTKTCFANLVDFKNLDKELQFATAVTMFGLKLKLSKYIKPVEWEDIQKIAAACYEPTNYLQAEFIDLVAKAIDIYNPPKKKKNKRN